MLAKRALIGEYVRMLKNLQRYWLVYLALVVLAATVALRLMEQPVAAQWLASIFIVAVILWVGADMIRDLLRGHTGLDILAVVSMTATLLVGEHVAGLIIVLMITGGEALEDYAQARAERNLTNLLNRAPQHALRLVTADSDAVEEIAVADIAVGDVILVRPSEQIPVDGTLLSEHASVDESALTGEPLSVDKYTGDEVMSGSLAGQAALRLRAERVAADSQYQRIIDLVATAREEKAPVVRIADRFALPFTVFAVILAAVAALIAQDATRFAEVLVLATPCPLIIAAPVAFLGGLSRASERGMVIKGGGVLEQLATVRSAAFDKTGTLTSGRPELDRIDTSNGWQEDEVLALAAAAERGSTHALADGIMQAADARGVTVPAATDFEEIATNGVAAEVGRHQVRVGKLSFIQQIDPAADAAEVLSGETVAYVAIDGQFAGSLHMADQVRPEASALIRWLRNQGVDKVAILTGDAEPTAKAVAEKLGINEVHAGLLPKDKVELAGNLAPHPTMMVGDGINDAPVLAAADVSVALGVRGTTAAGEAADAVILKDSLAPLAEAIKIARHTLRTAKTAIIIGIALSVGLMLVAAFGYIPAVAGALLQEIVDLAAILYALRALQAPVANLEGVAQR